MITLKYWNSLSTECRTKIAERLYGTQYFTDSVKQEYHHSFDFDSTGRMLKVLLSACYLKEGRIEVRCTINPTFKPKEAKRAKPKKKEPKTHKYYFRMYTESDPEDGENVWAEAYSESEARNIIYDDFHSITELDLMRVE